MSTSENTRWTHRCDRCKTVVESDSEDPPHNWWKVEARRNTYPVPDYADDHSDEKDICKDCIGAAMQDLVYNG
jgi:hypothetical protein